MTALLSKPPDIWCGADRAQQADTSNSCELRQRNMATSRLKQVIAVIGVVVPLAGTIGAIWLLWQRLVDWNDIAILAGMYFFSAIGITIGYHRMLTHRSFETHPAVRCF